MRIRIILLVASSLFAAPAAEGDTKIEKRLDGCKESTEGDWRRFDCPANVVLRIGVAAPDALTSNFLDTQAERIRSQTVAVVVTEVRFAGVARKALKITQGSTALMTFVPVPAESARLVACEAAELFRCEPYFGSLSDLLAKEKRETPPPTTPPSMAGRQLPIAMGCTRPESKSITCGKANLSWQETPLSQPLHRDLVVQTVTSSLASLSKKPVEESRLPCTLESQPAECREYRVADRALIMVLVVAKVRGTNVIASCTHESPRSPAQPPSPCSDVMRFSPR